jgi:NADH/NAD ratio-sensing transcriptional regulator Rex
VKFGIKKISTYIEFGKNIEKLKIIFNKNFNKLKNKNIIFYGSPAKATTKLNYFNIDKGKYKTIEDNELKIGKYIPNVNVEICSKKNLKNLDFDNVIVLAWNFFDEIKKNNSQLSKNFLKITDLEKN